MYPETSAAQTEQHLFTEEDLIQYEQAGNSQRFVNLLIDFLLMRFGLNLILAPVVMTVLAYFFPEFTIRVYYYEGFENYFARLIIFAANTIFYYTICEKFFRGYTLGKLITGTRAIRDNGEELRFKDAFLRSLCRCLIIFDWLSGFGKRPWHDSWTNTSVVRVRY